MYKTASGELEVLSHTRSEHFLLKRGIKFGCRPAVQGLPIVGVVCMGVSHSYKVLQLDADGGPVRQSLFSGLKVVVRYESVVQG